MASIVPFIATENLVKVYGEREVVRGVNLQVKAGEVVGLLGPNGAGKTTCFYMIVGLIASLSHRSKSFISPAWL